MQYFDHSTTAASDDKIIALRKFYGHGAVDAYWALCERVYRDEAPLKDNKYAICALAHTLGESADDVFGWICNMVDIGLIEKTDEGYISERMASNIESYHSKVELAVARGKASAKARENKSKAVSKQSESSLKRVSTNKTKQNKVCVEPSKAQQHTTSSGGDSASADDGSDWDWNGLMHDIRRLEQ